MKIEVKVPGFPESVADGSIVAWHKQPGDSVKHDEILVDIETDKVMFEVPAPHDGVLNKIVEDVGATVVSGQLLALLDDAPATGGKAEPAGATAGAAEKQTAAKPETNDKKVNVAVAPAAKKIISEKDLDIADIAGTGKDGRILKEDVLNFINSLNSELPASLAVTPAAPAAELTVAGENSILFDVSREKRVPMTRLRARIAERLVQAQQTAAMLTTFNEVNMQPVMDLRQRYKDKFEKTHGVRLGFMSFFVKASLEALKRFPGINASIDDADIVYHNYFDIGIAVSSPRGLVVPILKNADQMSLAQIEANIHNLSVKAKDNALTLDEITGGTFTITNGGVFGSMLSTPIINPPQSAILGMHKIEQRAVVINGDIVARPVMYLALTYDHRLIDGQEAVQFLVTIKDILEDPARIMLEV